MSFSGKVKDELSRVNVGKLHCVDAELLAIMTMCGSIHISQNDRYSIKVQTENIDVARRISILLSKRFKSKPEILVRNIGNKGQKLYILVVADSEIAYEITQMIEKADVSKTCCERAYIRGVFLASGSISNPENSNHLEIVCNSDEKCQKIQHILQKFDIGTKKVARSRRFVVYIKEGSLIVDTLNVMGAHKALMEFENVRIIKDMRNNLNRKVNCETANITKVVKSAMRQIDDINLIKARKGLDSLSPQLKEMAEVRLQYPDASLVELGGLLNKPIGKSGVNHRLRKLSELADEIR